MEWQDEEDSVEVDEEEDGLERGQSDAAAAAVRQAEAEGLTLQPSDNSAGYRGVSKDCLVGRCTKPFLARVSRAGKQVSLGWFDTAEEAALAFARANARTQPPAAAPRPAAAKRAAPPPPKPPKPSSLGTLHRFVLCNPCRRLRATPQLPKLLQRSRQCLQRLLRLRLLRLLP